MSNKRGMKKSGQTELSFSMIFTIILIVFFLVAAFYAIRTFLGFSDTATAGKFYSDLQSDITNIWGNSAFSSGQHDYVVPGGINLVCFVDFNSNAAGPNSGIYTKLKLGTYNDSDNLVLYPLKNNNFDSKTISYIDLSAITSGENPYCIQTSNGKVSMILKKDYSQSLVTITRAS